MVPAHIARQKTAVSRIAAVLLLLAASLVAVDAPAAASPLNLTCPKGVRHQLDGLYRWQVQRMAQPNSPAAGLASQSDRFTPELFNLLLKARQLTPAQDGRYLDFDVFSNTQVRTFGAAVTGCSEAQGNSIQAAVDVQAGLRNPASGTPRRLVYQLKHDGAGQWHIADITYRNERVFQLKPYLETLLKPMP